jgi:prepilin-type N-terminal cleavage/methylation domain-containing protein
MTSTQYTTTESNKETNLMLERLKARRAAEEGFTLIELLIVIIILAILATIVIFAVGTTTKNASVAACNETVKTVETAVEAYKAQTPTGNFPASLTVLLTQTKATPTNPKGPWLREKPTATDAKNGYAIVYTPATGAVTVTSKHTGSGTSCATA